MDPRLTIASNSLLVCTTFSVQVICNFLIHTLSFTQYFTFKTVCNLDPENCLHLYINILDEMLYLQGVFDTYGLLGYKAISLQIDLPHLVTS